MTYIIMPRITEHESGRLHPAQQVSREMERRLYAICEEHSITYVTISHRPALLAYHNQRLAIGDGKRRRAR